MASVGLTDVGDCSVYFCAFKRIYDLVVFVHLLAVDLRLISPMVKNLSRIERLLSRAVTLHLVIDGPLT